MIPMTGISIHGFKPRISKVEPAGISYEYLQIKDKIALGVSTLPVLKTQTVSLIDSDYAYSGDKCLGWLDSDDDFYVNYIHLLNPADFKNQDHYRVLGLSILRHEATLNQIRIAYRRKVLKYHPDKGAEGLGNEAIFACLQKAYEQLGISDEKRRAFDSIDPTFDEAIPTIIENNDFFATLDPIFKRNSRFSVLQPVPELGDKDSSREHVEEFYNFWFNWISWREFSYLDSEEKSKGEDRWERREIEKQNKIEREKRRKKDLKRISTLIEFAYSNDPRISNFKEQDKLEKEALKVRRKIERAQREENERKAEQIEREKLAAETKAREEEAKRAEREKRKKLKELTGFQKNLRNIANKIGSSINNIDKAMELMERVERVCLISGAEEMREICEKLSEITTFDPAMDFLLEQAKRKQVETTNTATKNSQENGKLLNESKDWSAYELQLLIKATTIFPPGTSERWKCVSNYIYEHCLDKNRTPKTEKDVIKQVKSLKSLDTSSATAVQIKVKGTLHFSQPNDQPEADKKSNEDSIPTPFDDWTPHQQKQLENGLKSTHSTDPERWDKIAMFVDGKTKKDCISRYKKLVKLVKESKDQPKMTN